MSTLFDQSDPQAAAPIRDAAELTRFFRDGEKTPDRLGIGVEYERLPVSPATGRAVPYASPSVPPGERARRPAPSIEAFLHALAERHGWSPLLESGRIIALERGTSRVTLEPGAQLELSGGVHRSAASAAGEIAAFVTETDAVAASMGFALLGLGCQPFTEPWEIERVPKGRYAIMAPWLARRGHLAHFMM